MTDIYLLIKALHSRVEWQHTPDEVSQDDLALFILEGIKDLYIITGRAAQYTEDSITWMDGLPTSLDSTLGIDEIEYVLTVAQISFFSKVKTDVNTLTGYSTDALSVSHADRPYKYLSETVADLERRRKTLWFKMARFNLG